MIVSMCGPLANKVKTCLLYPRKNTELASNKEFRNLIFLVLEQVLP
jgi:hypothetical protein